MPYDKDALKRLMEERGFSVEGLANRAGLTRQAIYLLIRGVQEPKAGTLGKLAHALGVSVDAFYHKRVA